jgi:hypothetical protein
MEYHSNSKSSSRNSNEVCNHNLSTASEISAAKNNLEDIFEDDCTNRTAVWGTYLLVVVTVTVGAVGESRMHLNNPPPQHSTSPAKTESGLFWLAAAGHVVQSCSRAAPQGLHVLVL